MMQHCAGLVPCDETRPRLFPSTMNQFQMFSPSAADLRSAYCKTITHDAWQFHSVEGQFTVQRQQPIRSHLKTSQSGDTSAQTSGNSFFYYYCCHDDDLTDFTHIIPYNVSLCPWRWTFIQPLEHVISTVHVHVHSAASCWLIVKPFMKICPNLTYSVFSE